MKRWLNADKVRFVFLAFRENYSPYKRRCNLLANDVDVHRDPYLINPRTRLERARVMSVSAEARGIKGRRARLYRVETCLLNCYVVLRLNARGCLNSWK